MLKYSQDINDAIKMLKSPLSDQATALEKKIAQVMSELDDFKSFNAQELINNHCDQLEIDVIVASESAHKHIDEIEKELIQKIEDYRKKCLDSWSFNPSKELESLTSQAETMNARWAEYFNRSDNRTNEKEVDCSLKEAELLYTRIESLKKVLMKEAFHGKKL